VEQLQYHSRKLKLPQLPCSANEATAAFALGNESTLEESAFSWIAGLAIRKAQHKRGDGASMFREKVMRIIDMYV
jgi:hypothetical protein